MADTIAPSTPGCAVCNPLLTPCLEETLEARRKEIDAALHIVKLADGYHIIEVTGDPESPVKAWPGPFASHSAADLFRDDLVQAYAEGSPNDACCSYGIFEHFNIAGEILNILCAHPGDPRAQALELARAKPWQQGQDLHDSGDVPF